MSASFDQTVLASLGAELRCLEIQVLQVNIGLRCDLACRHCHVESSPRRSEQMSEETMRNVLAAVARGAIHRVDITGGAPELHPRLREFIVALRRLDCRVMLRTNLTVLLDPDLETLPCFFRERGVELVASLPCYFESNVDRQRGRGTYSASIEALKRLNAIGYGREPDLPLSLVYNPLGPALPPDQTRLEADYRRELGARFGIVFTRLITIANMPIGRFKHDLERDGEAVGYMELLRGAFNPATLDGLMCRHQINVDWDGRLYDCDFNLALRMGVNHGLPPHIRDFKPERHAGRRIATGEHCFGCTAGCGSSCGGALVVGSGS